MFQVIPNSSTPLEWAWQHIQYIGWPAVVTCSWLASGYIRKVKDDVTKTIEQIDTMATNHFPHMEKYLENIDKNITLLIQKEVLK